MDNEEFQRQKEEQEAAQAKAKLASAAVGREATEALVMMAKDLAKFQAMDTDFGLAIRINLNAAMGRVPFSPTFRKAMARELKRIGPLNEEAAKKEVVTLPGKKLVLLS